MKVMINFFTLALFIAICYAESQSLRDVDVIYQENAPDKIKFYKTTDSTICEKISGHLFSQNGQYQTVTCQCGDGERFFGDNGETPKCRKENSGQIYRKFNERFYSRGKSLREITYTSVRNHRNH